MSLDFLRVIAAFAVVFLHVSSRVVVYYPDVHSMMWWTGNIADAFVRWSVPVFVMISGALVFSSSSDITPIQYYKKRAFRLFPPIIFWTLVYFSVREYTQSSFNLNSAVESLVDGTPYYHLWYVYMIVGLYLAAPFLRPMVAGVDSGSLRLLIAGCFTIAAIESLMGGTSATFLPRFLPFLGYFLAGHYLLSHGSKLSNRLLVSVFLVCGGIVAVGTAALFPQLGQRSWDVMYNYLNPVVIIMSLCIFLLFTKNSNPLWMPASLVRRIAPITLGIYLVHPLWLMLLSEFRISGFMMHPAVGIPVTTLLAFMLSAASAALLANIPFLKRTVC